MVEWPANWDIFACLEELWCGVISLEENAEMSGQPWLRKYVVAIFMSNSRPSWQTILDNWYVVGERAGGAWTKHPIIIIIIIIITSVNDTLASPPVCQQSQPDSQTVVRLHRVT